MDNEALGAVIDRYVETLDQKREAEAALKSVSEILGAREQALLEALAEAGAESVKRNGRTIFIQKRLVTRMLMGGEQAAESLIEAGLGHLATMNHQRMKSHLSEIAKEDGEEISPTAEDPFAVEVPEELAGIVSASRIPRIGCRKAS